MRITQGYVSKSVADFPFLETLGIRPYYDSSEPCLFIGCYTQKDIDVIKAHNSTKVLHWMGQDSINAVFDGTYLDLLDCHHISFHPNIIHILKGFVDVKTIPAWTVGKWTVTPLGDKIIAYCPKTAVEYHKINIINQLKERGFDVILSDGSIPQDEWLQGPGDKFYDQSFIGLVLNGFAGGASTIMQLGLKGREVVTNVLNLPHCIPFKSVKDIQQAILRRKGLIGSTQEETALKAFNSIDRKFDFLNLVNYK